MVIFLLLNGWFLFGNIPDVVNVSTKRKQMNTETRKMLEIERKTTFIAEIIKMNLAASHHGHGRELFGWMRCCYVCFRTKRFKMRY